MDKHNICPREQMIIRHIAGISLKSAWLTPVENISIEIKPNHETVMSQQMKLYKHLISKGKILNTENKKIGLAISTNRK